MKQDNGENIMGRGPRSRFLALQPGRSGMAPSDRALDLAISSTFPAKSISRRFQDHVATICDFCRIVNDGPCDYSSFPQTGTNS
jgi:hypothetical protein